METARDTPTGSVTRPRGRPRQFDGDAVLDQVVQLFWEQGFEATSVADIVAATGLNKSSLYNAFGSKEQLFATALERYAAMRTSMVTEILDGGTNGLADIDALLDLMQQEASGDAGRRGCLVVNTSTELGFRDDDVVVMGQRFRDEVRAGLRAALHRAEAAGEIDPGLAERHAAVLLSFIMSIPVITRGGADAAEIDRQFRAMRDQVADWSRQGMS